jgi:hypothetical protein
MQISQTKDQIKALASLQSHCELRNILLQGCTVQRARSGAAFLAPYTAKPTLSNVSERMSGRDLFVEVSFEYSAWDSAEPPERLFSVNCSFEAHYIVAADHAPSSDEVASFSKGNAVFNCWPYVREFLRDITSRLGHSAPPLPLLRIVRKKAGGPRLEPGAEPEGQGVAGGG